MPSRRARTGNHSSHRLSAGASGGSTGALHQPPPLRAHGSAASDSLRLGFAYNHRFELRSHLASGIQSASLCAAVSEPRPSFRHE